MLGKLGNVMRLAALSALVTVQACGGCGGMNLGDDWEILPDDFLDGLEIQMPFFLDPGDGDDGEGSVEPNKLVPVLTSVTPDRVRVGDVVTVTGQFLDDPGLVFRFPGMAATPLSASATQATVAVPAGATSGYLTLSIRLEHSAPLFVEVFPRPVDSCPLAGAPECVNGTASLPGGGCGYSGAISETVQVTVADILSSAAVSNATVHVLDPVTLAPLGICAVSDSTGALALRVEPGRRLVVVAAAFDLLVDTYAMWPGGTTTARIDAVSLDAWGQFAAAVSLSPESGKGMLTGKLVSNAAVPPPGTDTWGIQTSAGVESVYFPTGATLPVLRSAQPFADPANGRFALLNMPAGPVTLVVTEYGSVLPSTYATFARPYAATLTTVECGDCP